MLAAAPHRGSKFTLAIHRRCVLGISNAPDYTDSFISADGELTAAFCGSLDNSSEIASGLEDSNPKNPADLLAALFKSLGARAPNKLRGVFAGVVTDGNRVWCFRDHLGLKPLFYRDEPRAFFVALEAKQIVAGADISREPDIEVLEQIFYNRLSEDTPCTLKGVSRLPQAAILTADLEKIAQPVRYHRPEELIESSNLNEEQAAEKFSALFTQAVSRSLTGRDVVLLSGGVDSPAVAAYAAPLHQARSGRPLGALSALFPDLPKVDEQRFIELAAARFGIDLHSYRPKARPLDDVKRWCEVLDGPVPILSVPETSECYARASELGFRGVLTGEAAEFVFDQSHHLLGHLLLGLRFHEFLRLVSAERRRGVSWKKIRRRLFPSLIPARFSNLYLGLGGQDWPERIPQWLDAGVVNETPLRTDLMIPMRRRWKALQVFPFRGCTITQEADEICASLNKVVVRRPFADIDLWEFFLCLPARVKFPDLRSKTLVRSLLRGRVPDEILDRRDKTLFDDHILASIDYPTLRLFLSDPRHRMRGVDYELLSERLDREDFTLIDWTWANDLARIHAFLNLW
jgi:asparagine synthase (glutamine-hydrolysing)